MEILTTLLWPATIFVSVAVILNYFAIKSDLKNIKKLMSKIVSILMLLTVCLTFTLMLTSAYKEGAEILKLNQVLLFTFFAIQLILSITITIKITSFLNVFVNDREKVQEEENAFWCLLLYLALSTVLFIKYYGL